MTWWSKSRDWRSIQSRKLVRVASRENEVWMLVFIFDVVMSWYMVVGKMNQAWSKRKRSPNDMIFVNDVIKGNKLFLYALLHGFHEQEVSLGERLLLDVFRIYLYVKESYHVYRNSSWVYVNVNKSTKSWRSPSKTIHNPPRSLQAKKRKNSSCRLQYELKCIIKSHVGLGVTSVHPLKSAQI